MDASKLTHKNSKINAYHRIERKKDMTTQLTTTNKAEP